jgi:hypothetical protein
MIRDDLIGRAHDCAILAVVIAWGGYRLSREKSACATRRAPP